MAEATPGAPFSALVTAARSSSDFSDGNSRAAFSMCGTRFAFGGAGTCRSTERGRPPAHAGEARSIARQTCRARVEVMEWKTPDGDEVQQPFRHDARTPVSGGCIQA